jgi:phosphatidylglycerol:prolipoprotein diacylglycerol transferase
LEFPLTIAIGKLTISAHLLFETLAFVVGYRYFVRLRLRSDDAITDTNRVWIFIGAAGGAFLGSRLVGAFENPNAFFQSTHPFLYFFSSKTIVGGLLGGLTGVEFIKKIIGEKRSSGDLMVFPLMLAMIIGRIGCFFNGIAESTYGLPTEMFTGMDLGDHIPRHPVALYEIAFLAVLWLALHFISKKYSLYNGILFQLFIICYLIFRLLLDFIKPVVTIMAGLSTIQICCIAGLLYYRKTIIKLIFKPQELIENGI